MANKLYSEESIQAIAEAIRAKSGNDGTYKVSEMAGAISELSTGSGTGGISMANLIAYIADFTDTDTCSMTRGSYDTTKRIITT